MQVICKRNILVHLFYISLSSLLISRKEDLFSLSTTNLCKFNTTLISYVPCNDDYWFVNSNAKFFKFCFLLMLSTCVRKLGKFYSVEVRFIPREP